MSDNNTPEKKTDPNLAKWLDMLARSALSAGAEGVWVVRGGHEPSLIFLFDQAVEAEAPDLVEAKDTDVGPIPGRKIMALDLDGAETLLIMRFPAGDGSKPGVEFHAQKETDDAPQN